MNIFYNKPQFDFAGTICVQSVTCRPIIHPHLHYVGRQFVVPTVKVISSKPKYK